MHCVYCRPGGEGPAEAHEEGLPPGLVVALCELLRDWFGLRLVRITGGEPLLRPDIVEWVGALSTLGVETAMTTNGQLLAPLAAALREAGLGRVNVSLDTLDEERFARMCGGRLQETLRGIEVARAAGLAPLKTNTVVLRGWNEDGLCDIARYGFERGLEPRFLEVMEIGAARSRHDAWFVSAEEMMDRLSEHYELVPLGRQQGRTARRFEARRGRRVLGVLGIISPESCPFCDDCGRLRLSADGHLFGCFMQDQGVPCLGVPGTRAGELLEQCVLEALRQKVGIRARHREGAVVEIGG